MIDRLIKFSIHNKLIIGLFVLALIGWGAYSFKQIPIDAVPDITTNQVQVITQSPTLAAQEVEQFVTFPLEVSMANLPDVVEIRSISRFGISVITVVFEDDVDIYRARQLISEQLKIAESEIPEGFGSPELGPITSGLGEVYQYVLYTEPAYDSVYSDMDLRTINDWIVKRQLAGTPGVIEVSGWGGHLKQYEVAVNPERLNSMKISIKEVFEALQSNNENTGGSYIEKRYNSYFIRGEGIVKSLADIEKIVVKTRDGIPIFIRDIAKVGYGSAPRYGAITYNGMGEVVGGQTLMLKGENSYEVVQAVKKRIEEIKKSLPKGVKIEPYIDRSKLIDRAMGTVTTNLIEGGLIVILILVLLLGNLRGGLIVASVIPLAMLFAVCMMNLFDVSANLMSLGAIDFGLVVDGSVIIVEAILHRLSSRFAGQQLSKTQMNEEVNTAASRIRSSAAFGEIIILIVYLPILALVGIEGKMFGPMAQTVSFAIAGALILSMTYVPMMSALFLKNKISNKKTISDKIIERLHRWYEPAIRVALKRKALVVIVAIVLFGMSLFTFSRMGGEFIPTLEEGDFALHQILPPGSSLQQSIDVSEKIQKALLDNFPEIEMVVSKIGTAEIATDPMPIEVGDIMVRMKPKEEWKSASSKEEMFEKMEKVLSQIPGVQYEFTQPIQMRFNELIAGVREDIAIKIFGENPDLLHQKAKQAEQIIKTIEGVGDLRVEQTQGLPQMIVSYERNKIAQYGLNISDLNTVLRTAFAGEIAGVVFEEERRFDLVLRLEKEHRTDIDDIRNLYVPLPNGNQVPLKEVANIEFKAGPMQISRDDAKRRIVIGVNARDRDTESLVEEINEKLEA
jgi:cobalt-zinc-cadmium resistance protein CzcA